MKWGISRLPWADLSFFFFFLTHSCGEVGELSKPTVQGSRSKVRPETLEPDWEGKGPRLVGELERPQM